MRVASGWLAGVVITMAATQAGAAQQRGGVDSRFSGMDRNGDGVIARSEWRGSDASFKVHDWNNDGVLSGDEMRVGAQRGRAAEEPDLDDVNREYPFDDWTRAGFTRLDHNRDGQIAEDEWHFDRDGFRRADRNRDGRLSRAEFLREDNRGEDDDREDTFPNLDVNRDGRVSRDEWHGSRSRFDALDDDRNGVLTRAEMAGTLEPPADLFTSVDMNRNDSIESDEWHWSKASFTARDQNRDGRLSRAEFGRTTPNEPERSAAARAGYDRGLADGKAAGREDRERRQGWDLDGQREMEQADAGYEARMGGREEYQRAYREAFRIGYREGYGPR
jgi:Ca2+-binding EF-hand superfamily protein